RRSSSPASCPPASTLPASHAWACASGAGRATASATSPAARSAWPRATASSWGTTPCACIWMLSGRRSSAARCSASRRSGLGLRFAGTVHDPLDEIPVVDLLGALYAEGDLVARYRSAARIPAAEFLPYALGRMDDGSELDTSELDQTSGRLASHIPDRG